MLRFMVDGVLLGTAIGLSVLSGYLHRELRQRWYLVPISPTEAPRLEHVPAEFGDWELEIEKHHPSSESAVMERRYLNVETSQRIDISLFAARSGGVWAHDLERTAMRYGYQRAVDLQRASITSSHGKCSFWKVELENGDFRGQALYAWSDGGPWTASTCPGITYSQRSFIYRLEIVIHEVGSGDSVALEHEFLEDLLTAIGDGIAEVPTLRLP